jgi:hypothetical protein
MPDTGSTRPSVRPGRFWACATVWAFSPQRACGPAERLRCRPNVGADTGARLPGYDEAKAPLDREAGPGSAGARPAHQDEQRHVPRPEEWRLVEWPEARMRQPNTDFRRCRQRRPRPSWSVRRCLTGVSSGTIRSSSTRLGLARLGHYGGWNWRGFHRHGSLCIAAYGFLVSERGRFPPQTQRSPSGKRLPDPPVTDPAVPRIQPERQVPNYIAISRL